MRRRATGTPRRRMIAPLGHVQARLLEPCHAQGASHLERGITSAYGCQLLIFARSEALEALMNGFGFFFNFDLSDLSQSYTTGTIEIDLEILDY